ncbi:hypothetical protein EJ03DRAFT_331816 [Teratosphaeria nubilosa]|uniref:Uncharacterized protein n=1 Tax=Teratosphaeria nubilosa TaxID=161662 RepID=A0A6G1KW30_9PEZI|nr:hypothetical protein EJ03DRAFT_331816 [Teratosphaeria nubilosa]
MSKFHEDLTAPKPDRYYGTDPSQINPWVRQELGQYITPPTHTTRPAVPNNFFVGKGNSARADVARWQAMYDAAVGARAMHHLQNYGQANVEYDSKAYTIATSYHPGTTTLQMYATHPGPPTSEGGNVQYYITQIRAFTLNNSADDLRSGARAYRNGREWAQQQRETFVNNANGVALQLSRRGPQASGGRARCAADRPILEQVPENESLETSAGKPALEENVVAKRSPYYTPPN